MQKLSKWAILGLGGFLISALITIYAYPAVQTIAGLAVAQTATLWNNVKDAAFGDNATTGVLATSPYVFDGTNFDRARGDTTNGLDVDVTRVSGTVTVDGAASDNADTVAPVATGNVPTSSRLFGFNGSTSVWDRLRLAVSGDNLGGAILGVNPYGYDVAGANFDRIPTYANGDGVTTTNNPRGLSNASTLYGWNGTTYDRLASGANNVDGAATRTLGLLETNSYNREFNGTTWDRVRNQFVQSTTGVTTNAAGTTVTMTTTPMREFTMIIDRTAGSTDAVEIDLQCSINNTAFVQIATITDLTNEPVLASVGDNPCLYMRYNVVTVGAGNTLAIDLLATR